MWFNMIHMTNWVINGLHFNSGCCYDYGNAEIDSRDDDNGTMETTYFASRETVVASRADENGFIT